MKNILIYIASCIMMFSSCSEKKTDTLSAAPADTIPMLVTAVKSCSRLYTAEYRIHKIVTHNDEKRLHGTFFQKEFDLALPVGERKIAIPIDITLKAYIDFGGFSERNVRRSGGKIEIILPDPKVELTSSRVKHKDIKKQVPLLRNDFSDAEMASYERQGRASVVEAIPRTGIIDMAQNNAARILIPMLEQMGFEEEDITVTFRKKFSLDDIPFILEDKGAENGERQ